MKISHRIVTSAEGTLDELLATPNAEIPDVPKPNELLGNLALLGMLVATDPRTAESQTAQNALASCQRICAAFNGG